MQRKVKERQCKGSKGQWKVKETPPPHTRMKFMLEEAAERIRYS